MSKLTDWGKFRDYVKNKSKDYGDDTPFILAFGLASKVTEVYEVSQKECIKQETMDNSRLLSMKKVLWYIASIENLFGLPDSAASVYFGKDLESRRGFEDLNLMEIMADSLEHTAEISASIAEGNIRDVQYHLNGLLIDMADLAAAHLVDVAKCLSFDEEAPTKKVPDKDKSEVVRNIFKVAKKASTQRIKERGEEEILFDIKIDRRRQDPYAGVTIKKDKEKKTFFAGDMITDFFNASNYCANTYTKKKYTHNYGVMFRTILNQRSSEVYMGFIYEGEIMTATEARDFVKESQANGETITLGEKGRPILLTPSIKTLDDLLQHVNAVKATNK
jgi:hypothetical protein